jgi:serine/threonine protein phosphatase PrpC
MVMCVDQDIFVINVGDSRAVMSKFSGKEVRALTKDHKPMEPSEYERIIRNGGKIYQSQTVFKGANQTPIIQQVNIDKLIVESD